MTRLIYLYNHLEEAAGAITAMILGHQQIVMQVNWPDKIAGFFFSIGAALLSAFLINVIKKLFPNTLDFIIKYFKK